MMHRILREKTINNIKDASGDLKEQSEEAAKDFKGRSKQDYNEVKDIAEKQMKETTECFCERESFGFERDL